MKLTSSRTGIPRHGISALLASLLLCLSPTVFATENAANPVPTVPLLERLRSDDSLTSEPQQMAKTGLEYLIKGRYTDASRTFNSALQLSPSNSYLQLLNGLAYHLMATSGDADKYPLAEQGYQLAIQFDGSNWLARYFLGNLRMDRRNFSEAQAVFAEALLYVDADHEMIYQLAAASYYAGDPRTAAAALGKLETLEPNQPRVLRAMAVVMAALDRPEDAKSYMKRYLATQPDPRSANRLAERLRGWERFHLNAGAQSKRVQFSPGDVSTSPPPNAFPQQVAPGTPYDPSQGQVTGGVPFPGQPVPDAAIPGQLPQQYPPMATQASPYAPPMGAGQPGYGPGQDTLGERMVLVDVVILRTEDLISTRKGVNLLNALSIQFGPFSKSWSTKNETSVGGSATTKFSEKETFLASSRRTIPPTLPNPTYDYEISSSGTGSLTDTGSNSITRAITLPALTYSLNIANANSDSNEILARPTIAALEGVRSEFFSGTSLSAAAVATGTGGGSSVQVEKEIGVKLAITPRFLENDRIKLEVVAERTFLKAPSSDVAFSFKIETSKTTVNAQTVLKFGETLILSGLSEKETNRTRDGVPFLQDIPILQYIFSKTDTRDFQRSVLILVTPRRADYVYKGDRLGKGAVIGASDSEALSELRARYTDWFKPYPNLASVFHHLGSSALYREFRTGDVTLERWEKQSTLQERLHQLVDFLYY